MADSIPTGGVHPFRLTVTDFDRTVEFYTGLLGFKKLMDLNPGAFLSNGSGGLGIGPFPDPARAIKGDRFSENRVGLDHMSFTVSSRKVLEDSVRLLDARGVPHSEVRDLGEAFGIAVLIFRDPDNIHLAPSGARWAAPPGPVTNATSSKSEACSDTGESRRRSSTRKSG